jgi:hypothetical protein
VAPGGSTTFTVRFGPSAAGSRNAALHIASNDADEHPFDISLTGIGLSALDAWRQTHFGTTANTGDAADAYDFDGDGLPNLMEWACGLHPKMNSTLTMELAVSGDTMVFTYSRSVAALNANAGFFVEWSDSLAADDWHNTGVSAPVETANDGTLQRIELTIPKGNSSRRFARLRVTLP